MGSEAGEGASGALPTGRLSGRDAFGQLVRDALACAAREGWPELMLSDASFEDWPLRERAVAESLQAWSRSGRRFTMLATRYDDVQRSQPRFVSWRRTWGHIVECRLCRGADPLDFPSAIWSPAWTMQRIDPVHGVVLCSREAHQRVLLRESLQEWLRNSSPGLPATILGL